jgi:hypothetical protein
VEKALGAGDVFAAAASCGAAARGAASALDLALPLARPIRRRRSI